MGFYELGGLGIPCIRWNTYTYDTILDSQKLWTIRSAVYEGDDLNLPRLIGANQKEAKVFADSLLGKLNSTGIVIYYPFFEAIKSGTLLIAPEHFVIEAVNKDLWNLVTYNDRDVTIISSNGILTYHGNDKFLLTDELNLLIYYEKIIRSKLRTILSEGNSVLLEWSFAHDLDINNNITGDKYLVFYEYRTI